MQLSYRTAYPQECSLTIKDESGSLLQKTTTYNKAEFLSLEWINSKVKDGYATAIYDTIQYSNNRITLFFKAGNKYEWDELRLDVPKELKLSNEDYLTGLSISKESTREIGESYIAKLERTGYPFAYSYIDSISFDTSKVNGILKIKKGPYVEIDTIYIKGDPGVHTKWLKTYLEVQEDDPYNEKAIYDITRKMSFINFIKEIKPPELVFSPRGADLYLYLEKVKSSSINGVVGFLPDDNNAINITGDVKLKLENAFKIGEKINLNWRKLQPQTQDLNVGLNFPLLFGSPFGLAGDFKLYKRDSTFLEIIAKGGINYQVNSLIKLNMLFEVNNSSLLQGASSFDSGLGNARKNGYIVGVESQKLNRMINPSRGYEAELNFKFFRRRAIIAQVDTSSETVTSNYSIDFKLNSYLPLGSRNVIKFGLLGEHILAPELFQNELIRFGGLTTFRGFDEESLNASTYGVATLEYRFLLDNYSNLFAFFDGAFYEADTQNDYIRDLPFGFGGGIQFTTNAGTFVLVYALGKQFNNPILLKTGKIHFGYINYF